MEKYKRFVVAVNINNKLYIFTPFFVFYTPTCKQTELGRFHVKQKHLLEYIFFLNISFNTPLVLITSTLNYI